MYMYIYIYIHMYVCMYIDIYIYPMNYRYPMIFPNNLHSIPTVPLFDWIIIQLTPRRSKIDGNIPWRIFFLVIPWRFPENSQ